MTSDILDTIAAATRERVADQKQSISPDEMQRLAREIANGELMARKLEGCVDYTGRAQFSFPFLRTLLKEELSFICEVKKASPSKGVIAEDFDPVEIARAYEAAGASAISCLTEPRWFMGKDAYLQAIAKEMATPILRKDFVVDEYQVCQAKVLGASAVLLIVSLLDDGELVRFHELSESLGMSVLVEAHDESEIQRALDAGARIIGVNNRNLRDFSVNFDNARRLRSAVPDSVLFVAESGVSTPDDVATLAALDVDAVLVGEALMKASDKVQTLAAFRAAARRTRRG